MTIAEKLQLIARNVQKVFDGGRKAEHDEFWDVFQNYGEMTDYRNAFAFKKWNDVNFKPKYDIKISGDGTGANMFLNSLVTNLVEDLNSLGRKFDTSGLTKENSTFYCAYTMTHIPRIDFSNASELISTFGYCTNLEEIVEIILNSDGTTTFNDRVFYQCAKLKEVRFSGKIGQSGLTFKDCKQLSVESLRSILKALSSNGSGKSITLSTSHRAKIEADAECTAYASAATNAGWTIAYD